MMIMTVSTGAEWLEDCICEEYEPLVCDALHSLKCVGEESVTIYDTYGTPFIIGERYIAFMAYEPDEGMTIVRKGYLGHILKTIQRTNGGA